MICNPLKRLKWNHFTWNRKITQDKNWKILQPNPQIDQASQPTTHYIPLTKRLHRGTNQRTFILKDDRKSAPFALAFYLFLLFLFYKFWLEFLHTFIIHSNWIGFYCYSGRNFLLQEKLSIDTILSNVNTITEIPIGTLSINWAEHCQGVSSLLCHSLIVRTIVDLVSVYFVSIDCTAFSNLLLTYH